MVILLAAGFIIGFVLGVVHIVGTFSDGVTIGTIVAILYVAAISFLLLRSKKKLGNFKYILLALLSIIAAGFGGGILGLVIPAIMSTRGELAVNTGIPNVISGPPVNHPPVAQP